MSARLLPYEKKEVKTMKTLEKIMRSERGAWGWGLLWLIGIPLPVLAVLFLARGCT